MALSDLLKITQQIDEEKEKKSAASASGSVSGTSSSSSSTVMEEPEEEEVSRPELTDIEPVVPVASEETEEEPETPNEPEPPATAKRPVSKAPYESSVQKPATKGKVQRPHASLYQSDSEMDKLRKEKWYDGEQPTEVDVVARIYKIAGVDKAYGEKLFSDYTGFKENGAFKETYGSANSDWLVELGIDDPSQLTDDVTEQFRGYIREHGVTTASGSLSSSKKNGKDAYLAYQLNELLKDYDATKVLLAEQDELYNELSYWVSQGYTDEEIKKKVNLSNYNGINSALEKAQTGQYTPTTAAIPILTSYGMDGMLFAARNNGGSGDFFADAVHNKIGLGAKPTATPQEIARRTPGDPSWAPYAVSTTMHDEAMLFGVKQFDRKWLDENYSRIASSNDPAMIAAYERVYNAVERTEKAQEEAAGLNAYVQRKIDSGTDPERIFTDDLLEEYPTLQSMYKGQKSLSLVDIAAPVDFDLHQLRKDAEKAFKDYTGTVSAKDYEGKVSEGLGLNQPTYEGEEELDKNFEQDMVLWKEVLDYSNPTPAEGAALKINKPEYGRLTASVSTGISAGTGGYDEAYLSSIQTANNYAGAHYLTAKGELTAAQQALETLHEADPQIDAFISKWFPEQDKEEALRKLTNGEMPAPGDAQYMQDYSLITNQIGGFDHYVMERAELESAIANEQTILDNITGMFADAEDLNKTGKPSQSAMPVLQYMEQFGGAYDPGEDYSAYGDWQFETDIDGADWGVLSKELDQRVSNNNATIEELDAAIRQAEQWGVDASYIDNMRRSRDICELDNKLIGYAKLRDTNGFTAAVEKFDSEEGLKFFAFNKDDRVKNALIGLEKAVKDGLSEQAYLRDPRVDKDLAYKIALMTDNERSTYKYLYVTEGADAAAEYFDLLDSTYMNNRAASMRQMQTEKATEEHPVLMNALSIMASPTQALGAVEVVRAAMSGDEIDPNSPWFSMGQVIGEVRDTSTEMIVEHFGEGTTASKVATFAYQTGTSIGDSLAAAATGGGAVVMGLESFANTAMETTLNGGDKWDVILHSGITGLAEIGTEYLPMKGIEDAFKAGGKAGLKNHVIDLLKSAASGLSEAPGEALSELISGAADTLIMGELSAYSQNVQNYIQNGHSLEEAEKLAKQDFWKNVGIAGLQGAFAGSAQNTISYVGGSALKNLKPKQQETATPAQPVQETALVEENAPAEETTAETPESETVEEAAPEQSIPEFTQPVVADQTFEKNAPSTIRMVTALSMAQQDGISLADRTATVDGALQAGGLDPAMALAAAKEIAKDIPAVQKLQQTVQKMGESDLLTTLKAAAYRVLSAPANADSMSDAEVVSAVENDPKLLNNLDTAVLNSEIATETVNVLSGMDKGAVNAAFDAVRNTRKAMNDAAHRLSARQADVDNAVKGLRAANDAMKQNPGDTKLTNRMLEAAKNLQLQKKAAEEARLAHEGAKQSFKEAREKLQQETTRHTNEARQAARDKVLQRRAEQQKVAEEQAAAEKRGYQKKQFIPYDGKTPENTPTKTDRAPTVISSDSFAQVSGIIENARTDENGNKGLRTAIKKVFNALFGERLNDIKVTVDSVSFDGQPYIVSVFKNVIGKVISDPGLSAEKMSVLSELETVIKNASYITSSAVDNTNQKKGNILRYDYLSSPVEINGRAYDADLTIEVSALDNKMRTYQIKEIELAPLAPASTGYLPGLVSDEMPTSTDRVPQTAESVNSSVRNVSGENALASGNNPTLTMNSQSQQPSAPVSDIPAPPDGMGVSQFAAQTGQNTSVLSDKVKADLAASPFYKKTSEKENLGKAISNIERDGYDVRKNKLLDGSTNLYTPEGQVEAYVLAKVAKENGDTAGESAIAFRVKESGTLLGQSLAMHRMYVEMTPAGKTQYVQRIVDQYNAEYERLRKDTRIEVPDWLAERLEKANGDKAATEQVLHEAYSAIAEQMPPDWRTRLNGYRYLAMLGNSRTHIRNVIGNALFMPAVAVKNKVGAALETTFNANERTKALGNIKKEYRDFANSQLEDVRDILTGGGKHSPQIEIQQQRRMFNNAKLEWLSKKNGELLEREDALFLNQHFSNALAGYLQANNVDLANVDDATLQAGLTYAIKEAKKATYRDDSELADKISRFSRDLSTSEKFGSRVAGMVIEGALPFKKTPINVMRRGIEYSPIGLMKALAVDSFKVKNGSITTAEYFDNLASGITGTALAALGLWAYGLGHVKLSLDDKEGELDKLDGSQEYSIEFSLFGNDISYTLDWMSPSAMPFFVGAAIGKLTQSDEEVNLRTLYDALQGITEPVFNLSMMEGVNKLLSSASWSENGLIGVIGDALESYATQFVPSTASAFARTFDKVRRTTYTDKNSGVPSGLQYLWDSTINKIPGLSFTGQPYLNAWGEEDITENVIVRAVENFLSPGYLNTLSTDDVEQGLMELFDRTGEPGLVPKTPSKYFTVADEQKDLTGPEYEQLTKERGQLAKRLHEELFASPEFMAFDDEYKVYALAQVWSYATKTAQKHIDDRVKLTGWMLSTDNPAQSIISETNDKIISDKKGEYRNGIYDAVDSGDYENALTCIQGLKDLGTEKGDIKKSVTNHYKEQYKSLYKDGDVEGMYEIRDALITLGLGYTYLDFDKWLK